MYTFLTLVNRLADELAYEAAAIEKKLSTRQSYLTAKMKDIGTAYTIKEEIPGFEREEISISVIGDRLHVDGKSKVENRNKAISYLLPENASREGISATLKNGILTITIPKKAAAQNIVDDYLVMRYLKDLAKAFK